MFHNTEFDRACPGGNIAAQLHPNPPEPSDDCENCGSDEIDVHRCRVCWDEITAKQCEDQYGLCDMDFDTEQWSLKH